MEFFEFDDELVIEFLAACGVEDEDAGVFCFGPAECVFGDFYEVSFAACGGVAGDVGLFGEGGELLDGGGAVEVDGDEGGAAAFFFQAVGEFGGGCGFSGAVEAAEENAGGGIEVERGGIAAEELGEFVVEDFDDLFARFDGFEDIDAEGFFFDAGDEIFGDGELDVGFEESDADFAQGIGDVGFGDAAYAAEVAEGFIEGVSERLEHNERWKVVREQGSVVMRAMDY